MTQGKHRIYAEQTFDRLRGLDGISDAQIKEHLALYAGYVRQVNALNDELAELRKRGRASGSSTTA
jgi:Fe-Mn family superoxide dismutase